MGKASIQMSSICKPAITLKEHRTGIVGYHLSSSGSSENTSEGVKSIIANAMVRLPSQKLWVCCKRHKCQVLSDSRRLAASKFPRLTHLCFRALQLLLFRSSYIQT